MNFIILLLVLCVANVTRTAEQVNVTGTVKQVNVTGPVKQVNQESRVKQNFHCNDLINDQIKLNLENSMIHLSMSNHLSQDRVALNGLSALMKMNLHAEMIHAHKLMKYILMRGGQVITPAINRPVNDTMMSSMTPCECVSIALSLRMKESEHLLDVSRCASGDNDKKQDDPQLDDQISEMLKYHVKTNQELAHLLTRLERVTHNNTHPNVHSTNQCTGLGVHIIDTELMHKIGKKIKF